MLGLSENPSYPPLFRESNTTIASPPPLHLSYPTIDVPLIDLQDLIPTTLGEVCKDWGIFRLVNHGIPPSLPIQIQDKAKNLFSHPFESKQAKGFFPHPMYYFWDLPIYTRRTGDFNWVEGLYIPFDELQSGGIDSRDSDSDNTTFCCFVEELGRQLVPITRALVKALAPELKKVEGEGLASYLDESESKFLVQRYFCCASPEKNLGFQPHTDNTFFTILNEDDMGGLQIFRNHKWFNVPPVPNSLIVMLGDMIQVISDGEYNSVKHRVLTSKSTERISMGYFTFPMKDVVISSSKYKPFTMKEYRAQVQEDMLMLGFKIGLEHFKIKDTQAASESSCYDPDLLTVH